MYIVETFTFCYCSYIFVVKLLTYLQGQIGAYPLLRCICIAILIALSKDLVINIMYNM